MTTAATPAPNATPCRTGAGRRVTVVAPPPPPQQDLLGYHILRQGQRLDHLAYKYLDDADAYWRIAEFNDVMQAEWLTEAREIAIPKKAG